MISCFGYFGSSAFWLVFCSLLLFVSLSVLLFPFFYSFVAGNIPFHSYTRGLVSLHVIVLSFVTQKDLIITIFVYLLENLQVKNVIEKPHNDHLPLLEASRLSSIYLLNNMVVSFSFCSLSRTEHIQFN